MKKNSAIKTALSLSVFVGMSTSCSAFLIPKKNVSSSQESSLMEENKRIADLLLEEKKALEEGTKERIGEAYASLGWCYLNGKHLGTDRVWLRSGYGKCVKEINPTKAYAFFEKAALFGNKEGKGQLEHRPDILLARANQGDSDAQVLVGAGYLYGAPGFKKDIQEAMKWFEKSQEKASSCVALGRIYRGVFDGFEGVDHKKAVQWFHKAEKLNNGDACFYLALHYANGDGVTQDREKAHYYADGARQFWVGGSLEILSSLSSTPTDQRIKNPRKDAVMVFRKPVSAPGEGDRF